MLSDGANRNSMTEILQMNEKKIKIRFGLINGDKGKPLPPPLHNQETISNILRHIVVIYSKKQKQLDKSDSVFPNFLQYNQFLKETGNFCNLYDSFTF